MFKKQRKSAVDLTDLALAILVLGIVVSIGANILIGVRNSRVTDLQAYDVINESLAVTGEGTAMSTQWVSGTTALCINASDEGFIAAPNYTIAVNPDWGTGTITMDIASVYNGSTVECTYGVYNTSDVQYTLPDAAAQGLGEYGNWFDIIAIVGIAAVILSLIFMAFGKRGGSSTSY